MTKKDKKNEAEVKVHVVPDLGKQDMVNRPNHYAPNGVDSFMHMKDQMGKDAFDGFLQGNAIKYVQRYKFKGKPVEDLCKAAFYLFHLAFEAENPDKHAELYKHLLKTIDHAAKHYESSEEVKETRHESV